MALDLIENRSTAKVASWVRPMQPLYRGPIPAAIGTFALVALLVAAMCVEIIVGTAQLGAMFQDFGLRSATWAWSDPADYGRMLTYALLHNDGQHFFWNVLLLLLVGIVVEGRIGSRAIGLLFLAAAMVAGLSHLLVFPAETRPLVGASGIVSALFGTVIVLAGNIGLSIRIPGTSYWLGLTLRRVICFWVITQILGLSLIFVMPDAPLHVAYWTHLAGFGVGITGGYLYRFAHRASGEREPKEAFAHSFGSAGD